MIKRAAEAALRRRGWDSNPRWALRPTAVFETAPFVHSGTPPALKDYNASLTEAQPLMYHAQCIESIP